MVQRLLAVLLMVALVGSVYAGDAKEVVVSSAEELKGIKAKKITWKEDGAKMVLIPSTATLEQKKTFNRVGEPIVKAVEVEGPNPVPLLMMFIVHWIPCRGCWNPFLPPTKLRNLESCELTFSVRPLLKKQETKRATSQILKAYRRPG